MPLHFAAADHRNYRLAKLLLDHGASPSGYPHCDQATIERMYFLAREAGLLDIVVRRAYARFLPDQAQLESRSTTDLIDPDASEPIKLFARMVDAGGQPPFSAIVRDGFEGLLIEIAEHSLDEKGTPHDFPNSTVFNNIFGASRWYGYPKLVDRLMDLASERFDYQSAIQTIGVAISSHNRDGDYPACRKIIVGQLEWLRSRGEIEKAKQDLEFRPLYQIATDFTWHQNYGYRAEIAKPASFIDLAELFREWELGDINVRDPNSGHSPLSAAVSRGHHPGIATYVEWLLEQGADLCELDPDEVDPIAIAKSKGYQEILLLLENSRG